MKLLMSARLIQQLLPQLVQQLLFQLVQQLMQVQQLLY
jgi:hypothetical protein